MTVEQIGQTIMAVVPTGKGLVMIVGIGASMFLAGVGFTVSSSEYAELPTTVNALQDTIVPRLAADVAANTVQIRALQGDLNDAAQDRVRILCLAGLAAENTQMAPIEVSRRCP